MTLLDKGALRGRLASLRAAAHAAQPLAPLILAARPPRAALAGARLVGAYAPFGAEMDPRPLARRAQGLGARLALPRAPRPADAGPLAFHIWEEGDPLKRSSFGVLEPLEAAPPARPDLVLVPLLGFDRRGGRLGYGAGFFDRTLRSLRANGGVFALGLAYAAQEHAALPLEAHDEPLDAVVTEREWIPVAGGAP
jgi:5-formyltetrahydrofolate cyclo-ligase